MYNQTKLRTDLDISFLLSLKATDYGFMSVLKGLHQSYLNRIREWYFTQQHIKSCDHSPEIHYRMLRKHRFNLIMDEPNNLKEICQRFIRVYPYPYFNHFDDLAEIYFKDSFQNYYESCLNLLENFNPEFLLPIDIVFEKEGDDIQFTIINGNHRFFALACILVDGSLPSEIKERYPTSLDALATLQNLDRSEFDQMLEAKGF